MSNYLNLIEGKQQKEARNPTECDYQQERQRERKKGSSLYFKNLILQPVFQKKNTLRTY